MPRKVIQVPIDPALLTALDDLSRKQGRARAELIRQACVSYLQQVERQESDRLYQLGYTRVPEEPEGGEVQAALSGEVMSRESW